MSINAFPSAAQPSTVTIKGEAFGAGANVIALAAVVGKKPRIRGGWLLPSAAAEVTIKIGGVERWTWGTVGLVGGGIVVVANWPENLVLEGSASNQIVEIVGGGAGAVLNGGLVIELI
jgi:hypothetical protein